MLLRFVRLVGGYNPPTAYAIFTTGREFELDASRHAKLAQDVLHTSLPEPRRKRVGVVEPNRDKKLIRHGARLAQFTSVPEQM